jgi:hypothetical protein
MNRNFSVRISSLFLGAMIISMLSMTGCSSKNGSDNNSSSEGSMTNPYVLTLDSPHKGKVIIDGVTDCSFYSVSVTAGSAYTVSVTGKNNSVRMVVFPDTAFANDYLNYTYLYFPVNDTTTDDECTVLATKSILGIAVEAYSKTLETYTVTVTQVPSAATLVSLSSEPLAIAVDSSNVYWIDATSVNSIPVGGGSTTHLATGLANAPTHIAIDSSHVYWTDSSSINSVPIGGVTTTPIAPGLTNAPTSIALNSSKAYWTDSSSINMVPVSGGSPTPLESGLANPNSIIVDSSNMYWSEFNSSNSGSIQKALNTGGSITPIVTGQFGTSYIRIAADSSYIYWSNYNGDLQRTSIAGGSVTPLASKAYVTCVAVDSSNVYWTENCIGPNWVSICTSVKKIAKDGSQSGLPSTVAAGSGYSRMVITLDSSNVYWVDNKTYGVWIIKKSSK